MMPRMQTHHFLRAFLVAFLLATIAAGVYLLCFSSAFATYYESVAAGYTPPPWPLPLDTAAYNAKMLALAHYVAPVTASSTAASTVPTPYWTATTTPLESGADAASNGAGRLLSVPVWTATTSVSVPGHTWPHGAEYPEGGAILPFKRIVAYYGNFYSTKMGVLGEYPPDVVLQKLASTTAEWAAADPTTPVIPAIQYIAVVAQGQPGASGLYRAQMPDDQIQKALDMANQMHGLLILDVQVGKSTLQAELPELEKWLVLPNVELAIDPEFSMKFGNPPGTVIGTFDAKDVNCAAQFLAGIVREHKLAPKVLIVHRFTYDMVTNADKIQPLPEVEVVMDMDGWGSQAKKIGTYTHVVSPEPVQFTGIKLFYHADLKPPSTGMLTPEQVLNLTPAPIYIQYQ